MQYCGKVFIAFLYVKVWVQQQNSVVGDNTDVKMAFKKAERGKKKSGKQAEENAHIHTPSKQLIWSEYLCQKGLLLYDSRITYGQEHFHTEPFLIQQRPPKKKCKNTNYSFAPEVIAKIGLHVCNIFANAMIVIFIVFCLAK